ncbi:MAG: hypothetical protein WCJ31_21695 [Planctomycetia bacterium]
MDTTEMMEAGATTARWELFDQDRLEVLRGAWVSGSHDRLDADLHRAVVDLLLDDAELSLFDLLPGLAGRAGWMAAPLELAPTGVAPLTEHAHGLLARHGIATWGALLHATIDDLLSVEGLGGNSVVSVVSAMVEAALLLGGVADDLCEPDAAVLAAEGQEQLGDLALEVMVGATFFDGLCLGDAGLALELAERAPGEGPVLGLGSHLPLAVLFSSVGRHAYFTAQPISWCPQGIEPISPWTRRLLEDLGVESWGGVMVMHPSELAESRWWDPTEAADLLRFVTAVADAIEDPAPPCR